MTLRIKGQILGMMVEGVSIRMHYNFARIHQSLRVTPAMAAGITNTLMSLEDMVRIVDDFANG